MENSAKLLSERELEVLRWLAAGASNREISQGLYIAESTVRQHVCSILDKLEVNNRTQAALRAIKLGLAPHPKTWDRPVGMPFGAQ